MGFAPAPINVMSPAARAYSAGQINRLNGGSSFMGYNRSIDAELRWNLRTMRHRSRVLYQNNDYFKKYIRLLIKNVPGPKGIRLQNRAKLTNGSLDTGANKIIEAAFAKWGKRGVCDVTGRLSWVQAQWLFISTVAVDGECFVRKVRGFNNGFNFALQFIEADHIDENLNAVLSNGNEIRMGIEYDKWGREVAYHCLVKHPGDYTYAAGGNNYMVIPAKDMIHGFLPERSRQGRGVPWCHTAATRLDHLGAFEEAAIIGKRTAASKMAFLVPPADAADDDDIGDGYDEADELMSEVEPGLIEKLPPGWDLKTFSPAEPGGDFEPFMKRTLKGISSGFDVSYPKFASDLEGVSYSSIRIGELDDRDTWRMLQAFESETLNDDVTSDWLEVQLLSGKTLITANGNPLPYSKYDRFNAATWIPRGWAWVDPLKDGVANINELKHGLTTRSRIAAEQGDDYEELVEEMAEEKKLIEGKGFKVEMTFNGGPANVASSGSNKNA